MKSNYKYIDHKYNKDIYFPVDLKGKITFLVGRVASGKTTILNSLRDYYLKNNNKVILLNDYGQSEDCTMNYTKTLIPVDIFDSVIILLKLSDEYLNDKIHKYSFEDIRKYYYDSNKYLHELTDYFIIVNLFYILNYTDYKIIILDEIYDKIKDSITYLIKDTDAKLIISKYYIDIRYNIDNIIVEDCLV